MGCQCRTLWLLQCTVNAVVFPMRARLDSRRTRALLLFCTWLLPMAVHSQLLYYSTYLPKSKRCDFKLDGKRLLMSDITVLVLFFAFPLLFMLVLYPVIIVKLVKEKVPGNSSLEVIRRRKQNIHLTKMFITIFLALLLTYGTFQVAHIIYYYSLVSNLCAVLKISYYVFPFHDIFHAINPMIYFIFCSSYREGTKQIFSCCCPQSTVRRNPPGGEQIKQENVRQE